MYLGERQRGHYLQKLYYTVLLSIPPTRVESEKAFSVSGQIVTPFRTRLEDNIVDALSFTRYHYTITKQ